MNLTEKADYDCFMREMGLNVQRARDFADLTQTTLASRVGLSRQTIINLEKGKINITIFSLRKVAKALNVSIALLIPDR